MFHSVMAEEEGLFNFDDVCKVVSDKMVRRHPHVFERVTYNSKEEQHAAWEKIKKAEKAGKEWYADYLPEAFEEAKQLRVPYDLVLYVHEHKRLPVVNFAAGGVATPADAALMMQLGAEGVFVGSGIFKSGDPAKRASAIVQAVTNYQDAALIAKLSEDLGEAMVGINPSEIKVIMEERGQ